MTNVGSFALELLKETNCTSIPINLDAILEAKNIILEERGFEGLTGLLLKIEGRTLIGINSYIKEETRKRFTIAHELGHYSIPGHITKKKNEYHCTDRDLNIFGKNATKEIEANYFAAELLMPEEHFFKRVSLKDLSKELITDLCSKFKTSLTATAIRFVTFRTDYALVCSENSRIKWFHRGDDFPFYLNTRPRSRLHDDSFAYDFFNGNSLPETFSTVPAHAWIGDYRINEQKTVKELSIGSTRYNQVLSFLYIEVDEDDAYEQDDYYKELDGYPKFR